MEFDAKIYVAGHTGMVGSAILRNLKRKGYHNILCRTHQELDLTDQRKTERFLEEEKPDYVFVAAAKVGGIQANATYPVEFGLENVYIACNLLLAAHKVGVKKLLYLGSACCYPNSIPLPMQEKDLLSGNPERTNEAYAMAKNFGVKLCSYFWKEYQDKFIAAIPANCYGENDCFDPTNSHVIPALIQKCYEAKLNGRKEIVLWGSGKPLREFLYVDDLADASVFLMNHYLSEEPINIGTGSEISMYELATLISKKVEYHGEILCDLSKPDGKMRNRIDSSKLLEMGWIPEYSIEKGIEKTYQWYLENKEKVRIKDNGTKKSDS